MLTTAAVARINRSIDFFSREVQYPRPTSKDGVFGGSVMDQTPGVSALAHYIRVLRRGAWVVALAVAVATAAAVLLSMREQRLYRASAAVFLTSQDLAASLASVQPASTDPVRQAETQADLARTPAVAARALQQAGIRGRSAQALLDRSSVDTASNADLLTFSVTDHDPRTASVLATAYARAYTAYRRAIDTGSLVRARHEIEQRLAELRARGDSGSSLYASLVEKGQELRTLQVLQQSNALLVRTAGAAQKIQPRPLRNGILGGILGLVVGLGLAFLVDALNTRIRSVSEIEERLDLPMLGRLPEPSRRLRALNRLAMLDDPRAAEAEGIQLLATNFEFVNLDRGARTVLFTSATRGEGKSTTAANLAIALARSGKRVALVDLDLRRPVLDSYFDLKGQPGLTHVLLGRTSLEDALAHIPVVDEQESNPAFNGAASGLLELLTAGRLPPNPAEFVRSHALNEILAQLEERADLVFVDAPPLLGLSDAMTLSAKVDALIVMARISALRRATLEELRRLLDGAPTVKLGFVVTGVSVGEAYGYGYGYAHTSGMRLPERERERIG
jgi:succinoglycan biosynthesis transport protein ExoP